MAYNGVARGKPALDPTTFRGEGLRVAVVGGTGGIGRAIARFLVEHGARVTVVGRTFRDAGVAGLDHIAADLETVAEARRAADALPAEDLDAIIFTTGIITAPERTLSADGIEQDLAISYISRFVMIRALADRLGARRPRRPRVFVTGFPGTDEKGNPEDLNAESYKQFPAHLNTVAANEALVIDAAARYPRLAVFGLNPGLVRTDIRANLLGGAQSWRFWLVESLLGLFTPSAERYAARVVPAMFHPALEGESGFHLNAKAIPIVPSAMMTPDRVSAFNQATEALLDRQAPSWRAEPQGEGRAARAG